MTEPNQTNQTWQSNTEPWESNFDPWQTIEPEYKYWKAIFSNTDFLQDFNNSLFYRTRDPEAVPEELLKTLPQYSLIGVELKQTGIKAIFRDVNNKR